MIPIRHHAETFTCLWLLFGGRDTRSMTVVERHVLRPSYDAYGNCRTHCTTAVEHSPEALKGVSFTIERTEQNIKIAVVE